MNTQKKTIGSKAEISPNRYAKIHILFRELAKTKGVPDKVLYSETLKVKQYWKDFFGVGSLTQVSDEELHNMELVIQERIKSLGRTER